jgi:hypothetical protein
MNVFIIDDITPNVIESSRRSLYCDAGPESRADSFEVDDDKN